MTFYKQLNPLIPNSFCLYLHIWLCALSLLLVSSGESRRKCLLCAIYSCLISNLHEIDVIKLHALLPPENVGWYDSKRPLQLSCILDLIFTVRPDVRVAQDIFEDLSIGGLLDDVDNVSHLSTFCFDPFSALDVQRFFRPKSVLKFFNDGYIYFKLPLLFDNPLIFGL